MTSTTPASTTPERIVDIAARELGLAPEAVRRKNFIPPDAFPYTTPTGQRYDSGEYDRALTKALQVAKYEELRKEQAARVARNDRKLLGIGLACYVEMCGFGPFESAIVRVEPSGTVTAYTGTSAQSSKKTRRTPVRARAASPSPGGRTGGFGRSIGPMPATRRLTHSTGSPRWQ